MQKSTRTNLLLALALGLLLSLGLGLGPQLLPKRDITLPLSDCDLNQERCTVALPDGNSLSIDISPRPIPPLKPLDIQVRLQGVAAKGVQLEFTGVKMDMGFNRSTLKAIAPDHFVGQGNLPVCMTGRMRWQATIFVETARGTLAIPFQFDSGT